MKREDFDVAAGIVDRMDKLEKTIFKLEEIRYKQEFTISARNIADLSICKVELLFDDLATVVFTQDILELFINTLNLELEDLRKSFEEISA
jgi:hypothetical protein